ncbi:transposase, partial [Pararhizobium sp.]|uniref:transposase n=1 Tax=Pararhizobium sp. TaxID=1977563 RepID=UPI002720433C
ITNWRSGRIKKFRIRYKRSKKNNKIMEIPPEHMGYNSLGGLLFGNIQLMRDNKLQSFEWNDEEICSFPQTGTTSKIHYCYNTKKFHLIVSKRFKAEQCNNQKQIISLDPGIRTFQTGITENECIKIGSNMKKKIEPLLKRLDRTNRKKDDKYIVPKRERKNREKCINTKIKNIVTDLHWKTIDMLTKNYSTILIGDMSVQSISNNETSNLKEMSKRVGYAMSLHTFRERLRYKCHANKINYRIISERYTSKMCSHCGNIHKNLGSSETYKCTNCDMVMDRDVNGARNIYLKSHDIKYWKK